MFVYTQHTRSVHTAYTQCSVYTQRTHSAHTLMGHSESPSEEMLPMILFMCLRNDLSEYSDDNDSL